MNERDVFQTALDIADPNERNEYLDRICGDDIAFRKRIDALLASHTNAPDEFLEIPIGGPELAREISSNAPTLAIDSTDNHAGDSASLHDADTDRLNEPDLSFLLPPTQPGAIGAIGHYVVLKLLGQGAFGIVLKAFDEKLHRFVAIKAMSPQLAATSPPRKRFLREARSAAAIKHENIVQVYSVEENPIPYLVMEYVEGQTLQQKLEGSGPLDLVELLYLGKQIASGLAAAHSQGLIHRDIKPGNILIETSIDQKVKLTDFGLARAADDASMTQTGLICGTPLYMAPEQAQGHSLDHRADLFSFGSVLYHMACGRPPFRAANTVAILRRVADDTPRSLQEIIPETPSWLSSIISKLHAKNPEDRYQSAKEVVELLGQCLAHVQNPDKESLPRDLNDSNGINARLATSTKSDLRKNRKPTEQRSQSTKWFFTVSSLGCIVLIAIAILLIQSKSPLITKNQIDNSPSIVDEKSATSNPVTQPSQTTSDQSKHPNPIISPEYKWSEPENLGSNINTPMREMYPSLTEDELMIVFVRQGLFYEATREDRSLPFDNVKRLEGAFSDEPYGEPSCSMSSDGLMIVFSSGALGEKVDDVFMATRRDRHEPFGDPVRLEAPVNSVGYERHPVLAPDGLKLAVTVSRPNFRQGSILIFERLSRDEKFQRISFDPHLTAGWDTVSCFASDNSGLLKSTMENGSETITWHTRDAKSGTYGIGVPLQPPFDSIKFGHPHISADGKSLYFHSRTIQGGSGELDLWVSRRIPVP